MRVCILIRAQPGKVKKVIDTVSKTAGVGEAVPVFGRYDVAAFATAANFEEARTLARRVNALAGVKSTESLIEA